MRDAKIMHLYEGTSQIRRLVSARELLMPRRVEDRRRGLTAGSRFVSRRPLFGAAFRVSSWPGRGSRPPH